MAKQLPGLNISTYWFAFAAIGCNGGDDCCSERVFGQLKCGKGEGDCDHDDDCQPGLFCGQDNCQGSGFDKSDDCCTKKRKTEKSNDLKEGLQHNSGKL